MTPIWKPASLEALPAEKELLETSALTLLRSASLRGPGAEAPGEAPAPLPAFRRLFNSSAKEIAATASREPTWAASRAFASELKQSRKRNAIAGVARTVANPQEKVADAGADLGARMAQLSTPRAR